MNYLDERDAECCGWWRIVRKVVFAAGIVSLIAGEFMEVFAGPDTALADAGRWMVTVPCFAGIVIVGVAILVGLVAD